MSDLDSSAAEVFEANHVHDVYSQIAAHFAQTRYKPWPLVEKFLISRTPGSVGLDIGCGNGKYLDVNPSLVILGSDRSTELVCIARNRGEKHAVKTTVYASDVVTGDMLHLPHPIGRFDFIISIAAVHHLSTRARRVAALSEMLALLKSTAYQRGKALIYVWALEQKGSRRGWQEGGEQDVMVPWVTKQQKTEIGPKPGKTYDKVVERFYHLYRKEELEEELVHAGGIVQESGYERDNWWAIVTPG